MKKDLKVRYNNACDELAKIFSETYDLNVYWIGDESGGILTDGNLYVGMAEIVTALKFSLPISVIFDWQEYTWELMEKNSDDCHIDTLDEFIMRN